MARRMTGRHETRRGESAGLRTGSHVMTCDGQDLGTLKEIDGSYFKVDAPMARDYWLAEAEVAEVHEDEVVLDFARAELDEHKRSEPGIEQDEDPFLDMTVAPVIDTQEQLEQRARMERELAEQSRHLPAHELSVAETRENPDVGQIPIDSAAFADLAGETVAYAPAVDRKDGGAATNGATNAGPTYVHTDADAHDALFDRSSDSVTLAEFSDLDEIMIESAPMTGDDRAEMAAEHVPDNPLLAGEPGYDLAAGVQHPTDGETAFPQAIGTSVPYAPLEQQPWAPKFDREPPKSAAERAKDLATHPVLVAGVIATAAFTVPMYLSRKSGVVKLDLPMLLGTFVRPPGRRARALGLVPHVVESAVMFPAMYNAAFKKLNLKPSAATGVAFAVPHLIASSAMMYAVGKLNPRALDHGDADHLEHSGHVLAPGVASRAYGWKATASIIAGHVMYGAILGWWLEKTGHHEDDSPIMADAPSA